MASLLDISAQFAFLPEGANSVASSFFYVLLDGLSVYFTAVAFYSQCRIMTVDKTTRRLLQLNLIPATLYVGIGLAKLYFISSRASTRLSALSAINYAFSFSLAISHVIYGTFFAYKILTRSLNSRHQAILPVLSALFVFLARILSDSYVKIIASNAPLWISQNLDLVILLLLSYSEIEHARLQQSASPRRLDGPKVKSNASLNLIGTSINARDTVRVTSLK